MAHTDTRADLARRKFLRSGLGGFAGWLATTGTVVTRAPLVRADDTTTDSTRARAHSQQRFAIVNADDLGMAVEIDRGMFEAHDGGIVTSTSLMVDGPDAEAAIWHTRQRPALGVGLHVALDPSEHWVFDTSGLDRIARELDRQLTAFVRMTGGPPDHIDSHHHVHRRPNVAPLFLEAGRRYGVPVRGFSAAMYKGGFYGQPEFGRTDMSRITVDALLSLLRSLTPGISEVSCHPGYLRAKPDAVYNCERVEELRTLTDPRLKSMIAEEGIRLINYRDYVGGTN